MSEGKLTNEQLKAMEKNRFEMWWKLNYKGHLGVEGDPDPQLLKAWCWKAWLYAGRGW